jgi:hypothetical protein
MGYNTTVVVMNDCLDTIKKDPKFGENLANAIAYASCYNDSVNVPAFRYDEEGNSRGVDVTAATVVETHHADFFAVVAVGDNSGIDIGHVFACGTENEKINILKALAEQMGYSLQKNL